MKKKIIAFLLCIITILSASPVYAYSIEGMVKFYTDKEGMPANDRDALLQTENNDFLSRTETEYENINGKNVRVYGLFSDFLESQNNPNFAQVLLVYQCIKYKDAHPEKDVSITITSFHFSVYVAACLDPTSPDYGKMKNLFDEEYTDDGYYRLTYLLVEAARKGIEVTVIGQIDAAAVTAAENDARADGDFDIHFRGELDKDAYIQGKKVSDYMTFRKAYWKSYGDKSAADMMHNKTLTVSNYIDNDGNEHGSAVWLGSINIDGVNHQGINGNYSVQTGIVITDHDDIRRVIYNYTRLMTDFCEQEEVVLFRSLVNKMNTEQIALLSQGRGNEIPSDEQIVYIGTENDPVFELYFTAFGGTQNTWDTLNNPYCKYIAKLSPSVSGNSYIEFIWNNPKYNQTFVLSDTIIKYITNAFRTNSRLENNLQVRLPGVEGTDFAGLTEGVNIKTLSVNEYNIVYHTKDIQLSYEENGVRHYVTLYNSLNIHEGSMAYQTNTMLVINETAETGNDFYIDYAIMTVPGIDFTSRRIG